MNMRIVTAKFNAQAIETSTTPPQKDPFEMHTLNNNFI